jgi:hypothetical protein
LELRHAVIASSVWTALAFGFCAGGLWYVGAHADQGSRSERALRLGRGGGTLAALGYAAIWLPYAYRTGTRRRKRKGE